MARAMVHTVDLLGFQGAVGGPTYSRGAQYARQQRVTRMRWDDAEVALHGTVRGAGGTYRTTAYFADHDGTASLVFEEGDCDCPVGFNCKHVVALVLTAAGQQSPRGPARPASRPPTWEQSLGELLNAGPAQSQQGTTPLAVELTLSANSSPHATRGSVRVLARLVAPGRNGWVGGGLSWTKLASPHYGSEYLPAHLRLLRELYAIYRSGNPYGGQRYGEEKSIDLTAFESRQLWPMLDEADAIAVQVVHSRKRLGTVQKYRSAELGLDVTRDETSNGLAVTPAIHVEGTDVDAAPIQFIGSDGHGVVYIDRAEVRTVADHGNWHLWLARLTTPVPAPLQRMAMDHQRLAIPATARDRFRDDFYPRLRRIATVISSDDSFVAPAVPTPILRVHASYGTGHELDVRWEWTYEVGGTQRHAPLGPASPHDGYRDVEAERAILADLDVPFESLGPSPVDPEQPLAPHTVFRGLDTMRFTTEVLPLLTDRPDVAVEIDGDSADYREAGDSLVIGVSTDDRAGETDWFDLGVTITVEGREIPFTEVFVALSSGQSHLLLADGAYFSLDKPELRTLARLIEEARALSDSRDGSLRISRFQAGLWEELAELGVVHRQAAAWREHVDGLLSIDSLDPTPLPDTLDAHLRPYQVDGFRWLAFLWEHRLGGILADDMGLGKTIQSLALICHARQADPTGAPVLIVAPTSVVPNWIAEATRFAPGLKVAALADTLRRRGQNLDEVVVDADVVVTSYTLFRLDFDAYSEMAWSALILDEAQHVKNHQSKIHQCARRLPAPFKVAITGTPMENTLMELWSLLSITAPGLFPNPTSFRDYYTLPIEKQGNTELLTRLRRRIKPLVKRRTKEQVVADLPAKQEQVLDVELHPRHRKVYQTHLQRERQKVLGLVDDMNKNRFTILRSLTLLRQLSLHAGLVDDQHQDLPSSKIDALMEQLRDVIDGGHRALVFSQFTGFLGQVRRRLDADGVEYCYLDGRTRKRADVLVRFKDGSAPVFLISLKAGGFGLNLTEADYCFLLDPWWNPATEAQAVDRTHRIGQTRNVMVYRLIAKNTIEEKVMALKARKAELFTNVMDEGDVFGTSLNADDIRELLA
ncbi:MAG TPA: SNF2-related protein [Pseudonocardiaceae bacterium]|nr:SNF2-related protein [Pseudonocardiaceae bacterium]